MDTGSEHIDWTPIRTFIKCAKTLYGSRWIAGASHIVPGIGRNDLLDMANGRMPIPESLEIALRDEMKAHAKRLLQRAADLGDMDVCTCGEYVL